MTTATAPVSWTELEVIDGICSGTIHPECLAFSELDANAQAAVLNEIDEICDDIADQVTRDYPDLDDPAQRNDRLRAYRAELVKRKDSSDRDAYAEYFDTIMGVCLRNAGGPRTFVADESGCLTPVAA